MRPKSTGGRLKGVLCFQFKFGKDAPQIGRRPIKWSLMFFFKFGKNALKIGRKNESQIFRKIFKFFSKFEIKN